MYNIPIGIKSANSYKKNGSGFGMKDTNKPKEHSEN